MIEIINFYNTLTPINKYAETQDYIFCWINYLKKYKKDEWFLNNCVTPKGSINTYSIYFDIDLLMYEINFTGVYISRLKQKNYYFHGNKISTLENFLKKLSSAEQIDLLFELDAI